MLFLNSKHFQTTKNGITTNIPGFSVTLFHSNNCTHCRDMEKLFDMLDKGLNGVTITKVLLDTNKELINTLKQAGVDIKYVPYVCFFAEGEPYMVYSGPTEIKPLTDFIVEVANNYNAETTNTQKVNSDNTEEQGGRSTVKHSCKADDSECLTETYENKKKEGSSSCYTTMEEAYSNK